MRNEQQRGQGSLWTRWYMQWYMLLAYLAMAAVGVGIWTAIVALDESRTSPAEWRDWYDNTDLADYWTGVRVSACDAHRADYWRMDADINRMSAVHGQQMAAAWQSNNEPLRDALTDRFLADVDARSAQYMRETGWSKAQYLLCGARFRAEHRPAVVCETYDSQGSGFPPGRGAPGQILLRYAEVGYCIERRIPPFD